MRGKDFIPEDELKNIDKESQGIVISAQIGSKKRIDMINKAKELGIKILNIKDTDAYIQSKEKQMKERKDIKDKKNKEKADKKKKAEVHCCCDNETRDHVGRYRCGS